MNTLSFSSNNNEKQCPLKLCVSHSIILPLSLTFKLDSGEVYPQLALLTHSSQDSHDPQMQNEWGIFDAKSCLTQLGVREGPSSPENFSKSFLQCEI